MINNILAVILCLCLVSLIYMAAFTLTRYESKKRLPFIALLGVIFLIVTGYLLEITANTADGGFIAVKLLYAGIMFLPVVYLIFISDFCEVRLSKLIIEILLASAAAVSALIWTTDAHGLIYVSVGYDMTGPIHHITTVKGPLFLIMHIFPLLCVAMTFAILIHRLIKWDKKFRINLLLLTICLLLPVLTNLLYLFSIDFFGVNLTPLSMTAVSVILYINIINHNLFDILTKAAEIALQSIKEAFILVSREKNFLYANEAAMELLPALKGLKKESPVNQIENWPFGLLPDENNEITAPVQFSISENNYFSANISPVINDRHKVAGYIIIIQDITESVLMTKKLKEIAYKDSLTGIMNRQHFMDLALSQYERAKRSSEKNENAFVIMFDIDYFKKVNDTYGHLVGDKVLICLAERVKEVIRPYDLFARYGGEEFIMFISDIDEEDIKKHAERIRRKINDTPMVFDEAELTISASLGVAPVMAADDLTGAIKLADEALYKAKNAGRNRFIIAGEDE